MKRITAIFLALLFVITSTVTAFADPPELETPILEDEIDEMLASGTYYVPANSTVNTTYFNIPDRYFAYEMTATLYTGGTSGSSYRVVLKKLSGGTRASATYNIDGITHKIDWIDISTTGNHYFEITNFSSNPIEVYLTYYSWA